ncbi:MAG: hypothetical protein IPL47_17125 [Phyllobacteriaceae bacterium]|nr:hypothetical protein [Phyllobacteriaceae bacterium]
MSTAQASSIETIGADSAAPSPSIIMLGAPVAEKVAATMSTDPLRTAALSQASGPVAVINSPSVIMLGEPAREHAVAAAPGEPEVAAVAKVAPAVPAAKPRPNAMPVVMRGDFGDLRGSTDAGAPAARTPAEPAAVAVPEATPASAEPVAPTPEKDVPKPQGEQPALGRPPASAEMDQ